jgi:hypothetical protein
MNMGNSARQFEQTTGLRCEGDIESSAPQAGHLKCMIAAMKPLLVILLIAGSVHAQTVADIARKERDRQNQAKATRVITATEPKAEEPKPEATADAAKAAAPKDAVKTQTPAPDTVEAWNKKVEQLRTSIRTLQDQETALTLQLSQANNLVYAPVSDPASQQKALALVGQVQEQLAKARKDLEETKKTLDSMLLQGPPKK